MNHSYIEAFFGLNLNIQIEGVASLPCPILYIVIASFFIVFNWSSSNTVLETAGMDKLHRS